MHIVQWIDFANEVCLTVLKTFKAVFQILTSVFVYIGLRIDVEAEICV